MPSTQTTSETRHFQCIQGSNYKFWQVHREGREVFIRFGRIGTDGQSLRKAFPDNRTATRHVEQLIRQKTSKGYVEVP